MLQLTNMSTHESDRAMFDFDPANLETYLESLSLDGLEVSQSPTESMRFFPKGKTQGMHMRYWPMWLDFWKGDIEALNEQFGNEATWQGYYGGKDKKAIIDYYIEGLRMAKNFDVQYVVFHVCHVKMQNIYTFHFDYTSEEIMSAFSELLNEVLEAVDTDVLILFENLWWPGLTFLDESASMDFLNGINAKNKGFMLDVGHMMITNPELKTEDEAVDYVCKTLLDRPEILANIHGIHLNSSLSGEYLKKTMRGEGDQDIDDDYWPRLVKAFQHIKKIDCHLPFKSPSIKRVLELVQPDFLVHELLSDDLKTLKRYVRTQMKACSPSISKSPHPL